MTTHLVIHIHHIDPGSAGAIAQVLVGLYIALILESREALNRITKATSSVGANPDELMDRESFGLLTKHFDLLILGFVILMTSILLLSVAGLGLCLVSVERQLAMSAVSSIITGFTITMQITVLVTIPPITMVFLAVEKRALKPRTLIVAILAIPLLVMAAVTATFIPLYLVRP